ncbi:MAG: ATP-binding protein [Muribaculaceae bacterium]|nr:ATP-binding protein [Muribaculaceae bacterium]
MHETSSVIPRNLYLNRIQPYIGKNLIKTLVGQRRVGKSYILRSIAETEKKKHPDSNVIQINLEDFAFSHVTNAQSLYEEVRKKIKEGKQNLIFIDEIQEVEDFDKVVRSLVLDDRNDIYISGSNSRMLSTDISSSLSGRNIEIRVHPLSYEEFLIFHNMEDVDSSLDCYMRYGGMPYLRNLNSQENWMEYLSGLTDAIVYRDIIHRHSIRNPDFLQRLMSYLSDNIGQLFSSKKIADYLKSQRINTTVGVVQNYISYLEEACIVNRVKRWDIEGKRFFEIGEKIFYEDIGIRNSIVGLRPNDLSGIMENLVYNHLTVSGYKVKVGRFTNGKEIDFIAEKNGETLYFQVAGSLIEETTIEREFGNLLAVKDNYRKYVVTYRESAPVSYKGIESMSLREFLSWEV